MNVLVISFVTQKIVSVKGDLTFTTINKKTVQAIQFKSSRYSNENLTIDLSAVNNSDSAGLALMIEWMKLSKLHNVELNFKHIPEQLLTLAKLSGVDESLYGIDILPSLKERNS